MLRDEQHRAKPQEEMRVALEEKTRRSPYGKIQEFAQEFRMSDDRARRLLRDESDDSRTQECTLRRTKTGAKVNTWISDELYKRLRTLAFKKGTQPKMYHTQSHAKSHFCL
ncbi:MAG TPA: hypothetical protein VKB88_21965 [Bryobacteraceae bacterium]|nr:hypothetical protein [Bryobacteraceae bacterium]